MISISAVPIFADNYIWLLRQNDKVIAVDPGDAAPLQNWLIQEQCSLSAILITHHHHDHVDGLPELVRDDLPVYGPAHLPHINRPLHGGESLTLFGKDFTVIATPGHTLDHLSYYGAGALFCGDTLFSAGCGRLFEGTSAQMFASLQTLAALPPDTLICCTHEYTQSNLRFALAVEPNNRALQARANEVEQLRAIGKMSLPSTMAQELATNPFLRCEHAEVIASAQRQQPSVASPEQAFAALRSWKNHF